MTSFLVLFRIASENKDVVNEAVWADYGLLLLLANYIRRAVDELSHFPSLLLLFLREKKESFLLAKRALMINKLWKPRVPAQKSTPRREKLPR